MRYKSLLVLLRSASYVPRVPTFRQFLNSAVFSISDTQSQSFKNQRSKARYHTLIELTSVGDDSKVISGLYNASLIPREQEDVRTNNTIMQMSIQLGHSFRQKPKGSKGMRYGMLDAIDMSYRLSACTELPAKVRRMSVRLQEVL